MWMRTSFKKAKIVDGAKVKAQELAEEAQQLEKQPTQHLRRRKSKQKLESQPPPPVIYVDADQEPSYSAQRMWLADAEGSLWVRDRNVHNDRAASPKSAPATAHDEQVATVMSRLHAKGVSGVSKTAVAQALQENDGHVGRTINRLSHAHSARAASDGEGSPPVERRAALRSSSSISEPSTASGGNSTSIASGGNTTRPRPRRRVAASAPGAGDENDPNAEALQALTKQLATALNEISGLRRSVTDLKASVGSLQAELAEHKAASNNIGDPTLYASTRASAATMKEMFRAHGAALDSAEGNGRGSKKSQNKSQEGSARRGADQPTGRSSSRGGSRRSVGLSGRRSSV